MSIRARLLLLILFATLTPAIVVGVNFLEYRDSEITVARRQLSAMAQYIAKDLSDTVRGTAQLHYGLSRARDLDTRDKAACSAFLAAVLKAHPQYTGILTITPDGDLFCDSLRTGKALRLTDRRYFQQALTSENPLAVEPAFGRLTGIAVLQIAYAARHDTGEPKFVLLASLNLEQYTQSRSTNLPFESAVLALMDGKGTMLAWHPGGEKLRGTSFADSPLHQLARGREGDNVPEDFDVGGKPRVWATTALSEFPDAELYILVGVSKADLVAAANRRLNRALGILAVFLLLALGGAWALAELGVRRQSARVIAAVSRFGRGDFGARIGKPYPRGEMGDLMVALDHDFELMQAQRDVIQRLNADLERRVAERTAQIETSIKELEDFTYTVSHDLRTPLRAIGGFSRILEEDYGDKLDDEARRLIGVVRENTQRMGQLIDDLLTFSRLGRKPVAATRINMEALARSALAEIGAPAAAGRARIEIHPLPEAWGDPALIKLVWTNLLSNAIKFSGKREQPVIEVSGPEDGAESVYCVKDNGAGFDMQYYNKLFGVFQRLHGNDEFPGTGVGLAIVRRIVSRHGGRVWAEGKVDEGAAFYFSLPRRRQDG
jgi:signal transduction histidine kinase